MRKSRYYRLLGMAVAGFAFAPSAQAVPSFAAQTGQPCAACHIGAFGPQLTPFGRAFKIDGYTAQGGEGVAAKIPLSAMALGSFNQTANSLPAGSQPQHYGVNNNVSLDQISVFLAGRVSDYAGGFIQGTWSDVNNQTHLDQMDLRPFTTTVDVGNVQVRIGVTVNNTPGVQDPYNSSFAWGFPYVASVLVPVPAASPLLAGRLANNTTGVTAYAWIDRGLYLEAGAYQTHSPWLLGREGNNFGPGSTPGAAPYLRAAYEWLWNGQAAHIGATFMQATVNPTLSGRVTSALSGRDSYTDYSLDAGYQFLGERDVVSIYGIYVMEKQSLAGTIATANLGNGTNFGNGYTLSHSRLSASYWYENTYGLSAAWQKTWGAANPSVFAANPVFGSANGKPDSNAFIFEADWVPFGKADNWGAPLANLKVGLQYIMYTKFNGGTTNYDGAGRNAAANNTIFAFAWLAF